MIKEYRKNSYVTHINNAFHKFKIVRVSEKKIYIFENIL